MQNFSPQLQNSLFRHFPFFRCFWNWCLSVSIQQLSFCWGN